MSPPEAPVSTLGNLAPAVSSCSDSSPKLSTLRKRSDFLRAARAKKQGTQGMLVQMRRRRDASDEIRVGFTCSKKVGNAVLRNRAKRRLRALARDVLAEAALPGHDYVLIGKPDATVSRSYAELRADLRYALKRLHPAK